MNLMAQKPINVEAQRIQKVIAETLSKLTILPLTRISTFPVNLKTLSLLSTEVFEAIQSKQDEEISKWTTKCTDTHRNCYRDLTAIVFIF